MADYRDIGYVGGSPEPMLQPVEYDNRSQVYKATHDGAGNRLPFMNRSFISFTYGGKFIEDMGFIVINDNNQIQRKIYADFSDNVMENDVYNGQNYWSTHFKANTLELVLATDGVTERQLDEFKYWFKPGVIRELILAEHPNRAILARVAEVPNPEFLPFEVKEKIMRGGVEYIGSTTMYRGQITLNFVMDDPFWYARSLVFEKNNQNQWFNPIDSTQTYEEKDAIKIAIEDGVPLVREPADQEELYNNGLFFGSAGYTGYAPYVDEARVDELVYNVFGVAPEDVTVAPGNTLYFYYAGNAPCTPKMSFTITPVLDTTSNSPTADYIISPKNKITALNGALPYNTITIQTDVAYEFRFTTPSIWTGYNQAIQVFKTIGAGTAWEEVRMAIRDNVKHFAPRAYAIKVIDNVAPDAKLHTTEDTLLDAISEMRNFLYDAEDNLFSANFEFDGEHLTAVGHFSYRNTIGDEPQIMTLEEDIGDTMKSGYLTIEERNYLTEQGEMVSWETNPKASYKLTHDVRNALDNFKLEYKYMYL